MIFHLTRVLIDCYWDVQCKRNVRFLRFYNRGKGYNSSHQLTQLSLHSVIFFYKWLTNCKNYIFRIAMSVLSRDVRQAPINNRRGQTILLNRKGRKKSDRTFTQSDRNQPAIVYRLIADTEDRILSLIVHEIRYYALYTLVITTWRIVRIADRSPAI